MRKFFLGSTTKDAVSYACGEEIVFEITLYDEEKNVLSVPLLKWETIGDDGVKRGGMASGETGKITFSTSIAKPGFVRVFVRACSIDGTPLEGFDIFEGGAGAEIDKIAQGQPDPEGYDAFWAGEIAAVNAFTPEMIEKVPVESGNPDFDLYDVKITAPTKRPISAHLSVPKGKEISECGAFLGFVGYGVAEAPKTYRKDEISLHLNPHGIENGREQEYYDNLKKGELAGFGFSDTENAAPETCYFRDMIRRGMTALKWLATASGYNGTPIFIAGGSMGAMQATNVTARAEGLGVKVSLLAINVPWLCDLGGIEVGRQRGWRPNFREGIRYYDTAAAASRISVPVTIEAGLGDYVCPPSGQVALWHNFKGEKKITFVQNQTHPYRPVERITYVR